MQKSGLNAEVRSECRSPVIAILSNNFARQKGLPVIQAVPETTTASTGDAPSPFRWVVLLGVWLIYCTFGMTVVSLAPLVPQIMRDLSISHTGMGLIFGSWQLTFILSAIPCGALLDRIGVRNGLLLGTAAMALSSILRGYAFDLYSMLAAVAIFGLGGPIVSTGAPKLVTQWFRGRERGLAMGIYITGPALGAMLALSTTNSVLLPAFHQDWRTALLVWAGATLAAGAIWIVIANHPAMRARDEPKPSGPRPTQMSVVRELLGLTSVRVLLVMSIGIFAFNHGLNNWLPELLRAKGLSAASAGYLAAFPTLIGLIGSLTIPRLATPERRYAMLIGLSAAAVLTTLMLRAEMGTLLVAGLVVQGIARSSLMTIAILALVENPSIGDKRAATASGMFFSAAEVGGAGGPLVIGAIYSATGGYEMSLTFLTVVTLVLLAGAVYLARISGREARG